MEREAFQRRFLSARSGECKRRRAAGGNGMSKRILVVEDQPDNRKIIRDVFAPTGYEIIEADCRAARCLPSS